MTYSLVWLPSVLKAAGLKVAECDNWQNHGRRDLPVPRGVICHHTGGLPADRGTMTSLRTLIKGRNDLAGPLAQLGLGRDGTYYVIAAGVANHAGPGEWKRRRDGNSSFIGIEAENTGKTTDIWPDVQMDAYVRGAAAILRHIGADIDMCIGHREWARERKIDPLFDMDGFRSRVQAVLQGTAITRPLIAPSALGANRELPTLRRGSSDPLVAWLQQNLKAFATNQFDAVTEARVRLFQRHNKLVDDGIVGPKTWSVLEAQFGAIPA